MRRSLFAVVLLAATACGPASGAQRAINVRFGYGLGDRVSQPVAEGVAITVRTRADIELFVPRELRGGTAWIERTDMTPVVFSDVAAEHEDIVRIVSAEGSRITIEGLRTGSTTLRFVTKQGVAELAVTVAEPVRVELDYVPRDELHAESDEEDLDNQMPEPTVRTFVMGGVARFHMVRRDASGRLLGGNGAMLPVRIDPPNAAFVSLRAGDTEHADVRFDQTGDLTLRPLGGSPVRVRVVEASAQQVAIDVVAIHEEAPAGPLTGLVVGQPQLLTLTATHDDGTRLFGLIGRSGLTSTSPAVCSIEDVQRWFADGVYRVRPVGEGSCTLAASFDDMSTTLETPVTATAPAEETPPAAGEDVDGERETTFPDEEPVEGAKPDSRAPTRSRLSPAAPVW